MIDNITLFDIKKFGVLDVKRLNTDKNAEK